MRVLSTLIGCLGLYLLWDGVGCLFKKSWGKAFAHIVPGMLLIFLGIGLRSEGGPVELVRKIGRSVTGVTANTRSCRDCRNTVSKSADTCPDCGAKKPYLNEKEWKNLLVMSRSVDDALRKFDNDMRSMVRKGLKTDAEYRDERRRQIERLQLNKLQSK